jgi:hypothetical protein
MKTLNKIAFFAVAAIFCFLALTIQSSAQCVSCAPAPPSGFVCVPTGSGGNGCMTEAGTCQLVGGPCVPPDKEAPEGRGTSESCKLKLISNSHVSISDSIIREVGAIDTRLAIALINVSRIKAEYNFARISFSSLNYTFDDVENHLAQPGGSAYFKQIKKLAGESLAKDGIVITYEISIHENRGANSHVLSITPVEGAGMSIDLDLQSATFGKGKYQSEGFKAVSFQFK